VGRVRGLWGLLLRGVVQGILLRRFLRGVQGLRRLDSEPVTRRRRGGHHLTRRRSVQSTSMVSYRTIHTTINSGPCIGGGDVRQGRKYHSQNPKYRILELVHKEI
jgi:hypothetical protein